VLTLLELILLVKKRNLLPFCEVNLVTNSQIIARIFFFWSDSWCCCQSQLQRPYVNRTRMENLTTTHGTLPMPYKARPQERQIFYHSSSAQIQQDTLPTYDLSVSFFNWGSVEKLFDLLKNINWVCTGQNISNGPSCYSLAHWLIQSDALGAFNQVVMTHGNKMVAGLDYACPTTMCPVNAVMFYASNAM